MISRRPPCRPLASGQSFHRGLFVQCAAPVPSQPIAGPAALLRRGRFCLPLFHESAAGQCAHGPADCGARARPNLRSLLLPQFRRRRVHGLGCRHHRRANFTGGHFRSFGRLLIVLRSTGFGFGSFAGRETDAGRRSGKKASPHNCRGGNLGGIRLKEKQSVERIFQLNPQSQRQHREQTAAQVNFADHPVKGHGQAQNPKSEKVKSRF